MPIAAVLLAACTGTRPPLTEAVALRPYAASWERILAAEDARTATPTQLAALRDGARTRSPELRRVAVRALGRLERADLAADIAPLLADDDAAVRAQAANALAQAARGGDVDRAPLEAAFSAEQDGSAAGVMAEALGRMRPADPAAGRATGALLGRRLHDAADTRERLGIVRGLYFLVRQPGMRTVLDDVALDALRHAATVPSPEGASPAEGLPGAERSLPDGAPASGGRDATAAVRLRAVAAAALTAAGAVDEPLAGRLLQDDAWTVRREAMLAAAALTDTASVRRLLASALDDAAPQVRYEALRGHGRRLAASHGCAPVRAALGDDAMHVRLLAVDLLGGPCRETAAGGLAAGASGADAATLEALIPGIATAQWHIGARALVALAQLDSAAAHRRLDDLGPVPDPFARAYVARAAGIVADTATLLRLAGDTDVNVRTAAVRELHTHAGHDAGEVYLAQLRADDSQLLQAAAAALEGSPSPAAPGALLDALDRMTQRREETSRDARRALLRRAGELGDSRLAPRVTPYLRDFDAVIAELAADVLEGWTGTRPQPAPQPLQRQPLPTFDDVARLAASRVEIEMEDGAIVLLRLLPFEAPTNAARFARLAEAGYYDGLTLHRIVPNFVAQGGSPHANEYTGDGPFTRDELGPAGNWRGAVGLSTRGRDTGDAQFYINLVDNVRLDHEYTVFADVVDGMDVVDAMLEGARMRSVRVVPAAPPAGMTPGQR